MSDPVTTISTQDTAAREGSRHQDGKFGTQVRADNTAPLSARNFHPTSQDTRVIGQWDVRDDWQADQLDDAFGQAPSPHATSAVRCVVCGRELANVTLMESEDYGRFPLGSDCAQTVGLAAVLETGVAEIRASANREKVYEQHPWARALEELKDGDRVMLRIHSDIGKYGRADPYRLDEVRWAAERAKGREVTREEIAEARRKINTDDAPGLAEAFEMRDRNKFIAQMYESAGHGPLTERQVYAAIGAAERERTKLVREIRHSAIKAAPAPAGRTRVRGEVLSTRAETSRFGGKPKTTIKMLLLDERGFRVRVTAPSKVAGFNDGHVPRDLRSLSGKIIAFDATLEPSANDERYAYGSRPGRAELVSDEGVAS